LFVFLVKNVSVLSTCPEYRTIPQADPAMEDNDGYSAQGLAANITPRINAIFHQVKLDAKISYWA
jgi:hypothetical protein